MPNYYAKLYTSAILNDDRSPAATVNGFVVDWDKANKFIYAVQIGHDERDTVAGAYKLQWRLAGGTWADVGATGAVKYANSSTLTNGTALTLENSKCYTPPYLGMTWQNGEEIEDGLSLLIDLGSDCYTELQFACDISGGEQGKTYEFQLYNNTKGEAVAIASGVFATLRLGLTSEYVFGNRTGTASRCAAGRIYYSRHMCMRQVSSLELMWIVGQPFTPSIEFGHVRVAIYSDNNGEPGTLLADSGSIYADDFYSEFPTRVLDKYTYYWIAAQAENISLYVYTIPAANARIEYQSYGAFPSTASPSAGTQGAAVEIYGTLVPQFKFAPSLGLIKSGDATPLSSTLTTSPGLIDEEKDTVVTDSYPSVSVGAALAEPSLVERVVIYLNYILGETYYVYGNHSIFEVYSSSDNSTWTLRQTFTEPYIPHEGNPDPVELILYPPVADTYFKIRPGGAGYWAFQAGEDAYQLRVAEIELYGCLLRSMGEDVTVSDVFDALMENMSLRG